jgi:hypothetical protein
MVLRILLASQCGDEPGKIRYSEGPPEQLCGFLQRGCGKSHIR